MNRLRRLRASSALSFALLAALALAASASAETRSGEASSPVNPAISGKADILAGTASYDATTGSISVGLTTREARGEGEETAVFAALGRPKDGACGLTFSASVPPEPMITLPAVQISAPESNPSFPINQPPSWFEVTGISPEGFSEAGGFGRAFRSIDGTTTTLKANSPELTGKPFTCAAIAIQSVPTIENPTLATLDELSIPLITQPEPAAAPKPQPQVPTPGAISFATSKPATAEVGKWTKVKVKVTNGGGTAIGPITFKAKAPKGVIVKPGAPKLPALLGGQTWNVVLNVKATEAAKARSTITLVGTSGALSASGSVVLKTAG
jgi:hypothetical protein